MAIGIVLTLAAVLLAVVVALSVHGSALDAVVEAPLALRREQVRWRRGGVVTGLAAAISCAAVGGLGVGILLAAPLFGVFVIAGVCGGELRVTAPTSATSSASVTIRTASLYLPRTLTKSVLGSSTVLAVILVGTSLIGSRDDLGRQGRALSRACGAMSSTTGPWPGTYYTVPLAVLLVVGLALAVAAVRHVVDRARPGSSPGVTAADDQLRRLAAGTVVGAAGVLIAVTLLGTSLTAAGALLRNTCSRGGWHVAGWTLLASTPLWLALLAVSFGAINAGMRRLTVDA